METNKLLELLLKYEEYIQKGNDILKKVFNTDLPPLLAKRKGLIPSEGVIESEKLSFKFHGMGCLFNFENTIVDFDYSFGDFIYKGFEADKFYQFVVSFPESSEIKKKDTFNSALIELQSKGMIIEKDSDCIDTYKYIRK